MWRAFQEDDSETALRAYQATKEDLIQWLKDEQDLRTKLEERLALEEELEASKHHNKVRAIYTIV